MSNCKSFKAFVVLAALGVAVALAPPARCFAHGHPAGVNVVPNAPGGKITVTAGTADPDGYASQIFAETSSELWLDSPNPMLAFTDAPGLVVNDLSAGAELFYEIVPRPDLTAAGHPQRWLWQWNPASGAVAPAAAQPTISLLPDDDDNENTPPLPMVTFGQATPPANSLIKIADVASNDIGEHVHYLYYLFNHSVQVPNGVYGFFARLASPGFESSDPFLIALNLNVGATNYQLAAKEINAAAGLAGDFDADADVDGGDFLLWQQTFGATGSNLPADGSLNKIVDGADLGVWRNQFGRQVTIPTAAAVSAAIPEPTGWMLTATILAGGVLARRRCQLTSLTPVI